MTFSRSFPLLLALATVLALSGCGHARVVRMESGRTEPARHGSRPANEGRALARGEYVVQPGDTLYSISRRHGLDYHDVARWNGIDAPYAIQVGQRLSLRGAASATATGPRPAAPVAGQGGSVAASAPPRSTTRDTTPVATPAPSAPADSSAPPWRWPTQGQIVGRYVAGDPTQQGINIAGNAGQKVVAAADGVVVYSGAGLVGYGELIIVKHSDQWLSAYAHNRRRLVAEGARVKAGDVIAEMGRTGAIRDMLHFEIRRNGKPVDPLQYLPAQ